MKNREELQVQLHWTFIYRNSKDKICSFIPDSKIFPTFYDTLLSTYYITDQKFKIIFWNFNIRLRKFENYFFFELSSSYWKFLGEK